MPEKAVRTFGEEHPAEFFRDIVEALADSFDTSDAAAYERLMRVWLPETARALPAIPERIDTVYVLSRVTLGSDIKIVSPILGAMKQRFPAARIIFVGAKKSAELFDAEFLEANYPRSGPVSARLEFARQLRTQLDTPNRIVVDPDSRMTQLGLIPVCEPERYFHFPSRTAGTETDNLSDLVNAWLFETFNVTGSAAVSPALQAAGALRPQAAISLGVGGNQTKRIEGDFEASLIQLTAQRYPLIHLDRGAGGEEAVRVTAAAEASGALHKIHFWEGSFAGFASLIAQSDLYIGYDSAGQHVAAATNTKLITIFAGAPSKRFQCRWAPTGPATVLHADRLTPEAVLSEIRRQIAP